MKLLIIKILNKRKISFLIQQVIKISNGKASPSLVSQALYKYVHNK